MTDTVTMSTTVATTDTPAWTPPTWEDIVAQHSGRVYRLAYRLTGNPHDAEDLTHDVFIRVFRVVLIVLIDIGLDVEVILPENVRDAVVHSVGDHS